MRKICVNYDNEVPLGQDAEYFEGAGPVRSINSDGGKIHVILGRKLKLKDKDGPEGRYCGFHQAEWD